ncbi:hypothetical protein D3C78_1711650 [compost metagenome]
MQQIGSQARADGELRPGIGHFLQLLRVDDGTGADDGIRHFFGNSTDRVHGAGGAQGDFQYPDATGHQGFRQRDRVFQFVDDDHRDYRAGHQDLLCAGFPIVH